MIKHINTFLIISFHYKNTTVRHHNLFNLSQYTIIRKFKWNHFYLFSKIGQFTIIGFHICYRYRNYIINLSSLLPFFS